MLGARQGTLFRRLFTVLAVAVSAAVFVAWASPARGDSAPPQKLPPLPVPAIGDARGVTVSGVSAGGYMAVQFHVAHSTWVPGVGVLAGGPYYCAQGSLWTAYYNCQRPTAFAPLPAVETLKARTEAFAREGLIDPTSNLGRARVWLFSGTQDTTVEPTVVQALERFYRAFGAAVVLVRDQPAGHGMVTADAGVACGRTESPFINDCDYDAAGELLGYLLGPLKPPGKGDAGRLVSFDQNPFAGGSARAISLADKGYYYVPRACETEPCRIHVAFHGCRQNADAVGESFVREAGYNRWADTNRLIILYPQTAARYGFSLSALNFVFNPRACWDWWGYTGAQYHTKQGAQIEAVKAMVDWLAGNRIRGQSPNS